MKRFLVLFAVVVTGSVLGACTMLVIDDPEPTRPGAVTAPVVDARPAAATDPVLLVWTPDGLPAGLAAGIESLATAARVTEVRGDLVELSDPSAPAGMVVPLDALSVDPASYATFLPKGAAATVAALDAGEAILGATSARLRGVTTGGSLTLASGQTLAVVGVLDDKLVGSAELVVAHDTVPQVATPRFVLVAYDGPRDAIEQQIRTLLPPSTPVRFRAPGETPLLRHGDAVLPQATLKEQFGEFAYRRLADGELEIDPAWVRANIVEVELPLLGPTRCHRAIVDHLRTAMVELEQRNLGYLVVADGDRGCFVPRLIPTGGGVSRHAWGIAIDINWPKNRQGELGTQDPRLVATLAARGFTSGAPWLVPDPAHFEWVDV